MVPLSSGEAVGDSGSQTLVRTPGEQCGLGGLFSEEPTISSLGPSFQSLPLHLQSSDEGIMHGDPIHANEAPMQSSKVDFEGAACFFCF